MLPWLEMLDGGAILELPARDDCAAGRALLAACWWIVHGSMDNHSMVLLLSLSIAAVHWDVLKLHCFTLAALPLPLIASASCCCDLCDL
jgi:hypothetical protein